MNRFLDSGEFIIHVRFNGRNFDLSLSSLGLAPTSRDELIKRVLADELGVPTAEMDDYGIERHANGNLTLRSEVLFV